MSNTLIVVLLSVTAALAFALSSSLKHVSAGRVPDAQSMHPTKLARFVRATVTHRLWLAGIGCDVVGVSMQTLALHLGALGVVQFLLLSSLLFALILRGRFENHHVSRRQAVWAVVLTVSLAAFLLLADPTPGTVTADRGTAVVAGVAAAVLAGVCILFGRLTRRPTRAAALLGVSVGVFYATTAALLKAVTDIAADDPMELLTSWQPYALGLLGAAGMVLSQLAFQAGPLTAALPATASTDPMLSLGIGVFVYHEQLRGGLGVGIGLMLLLAVLVTAVVQLSRTPADGPEPVSALPRAGGALRDR